MNGMVMTAGRRTGTVLKQCAGFARAAGLKELLIMAACSRARVGPGITPLAAAYFAANMRNETRLPALLAGCALGAFCTGFDSTALFAPVVCALMLIIRMLADALGSKISALRMEEGTCASLAAGLSVLLPALAMSGFEPDIWLMSLVCAAAAAVIAPALVAADVWWCAQVRMLAAACTVVLLAAGMGADPLPVACLCAVAAGAAGRGAVTGAVLGAVCALSGGTETCFAAGMLGAAADMAPRTGRQAVWRSALALAACIPLAFIPGDGGRMLWLAIAAAAQAFIPAKWSESIAASCSPPARRDQRLINALRRRDEARLRSLSDAFAGLSEACGAGDPAFGEQQLISKMRAALCAGCPSYARCWPGSNSGAVKLFCQLMTSAIECGGSPFEGGEVPPDIMRLCRRGMTVPARLGNLLSEFAVQRHRRIRLMEARRLIGAQFSQAAEVLNAMAQEHVQPFVLRDGAAAHAKRALADAGFPVRDVMAVRMDGLEVNVAIEGRWTRDRLDAAAGILGRCLGGPYTVHTATGGNAVFVPGGALRTEVCCSALPADPDHPCGDSSLVREMGRRIFVALSDGMGSGEAAAEESRRVISLMHSLVSAGLPRELALSTINGVLLSRGGEELFATADMLLIDLDSGRAEFTKLAASRSYIVRGNRVHVVEGGRLPLGILDEVQPGVKCADLRRGDVVFMMTDGITDALTEKQLADTMLKAVSSGTEDMARFLVDTAAVTSRGRRDDMTAVCVKIA